MAQEITAPRADVLPDTAKVTKTLLACGIAAAPVFIVLVGWQMLIRDGFDLRRHPISLLSTGDLGWIQVTAFVASGLLSVAFAVGIRRALHPGRAGTWGPLLIALYGLGLIAGGVFVADPALGFPPGAPEGIPQQISWHAAIHGFAPPIAFNALIVACFVFTRRFVGLRQRGWTIYTLATAVVTLAFASWPTMAGISWRLAVAVTLAFVWEAALAARLSSELTGKSHWLP